MAHEGTTMNMPIKVPFGWMGLNDQFYATNVGAFFSSGTSLLSKLILRLSLFSHCGLVFRLESANDLVLVYFEALYARGFRGPRPMRDLHSWTERDPRRKLEVLWLDTSIALAHSKYYAAQGMVGKAGYSELQVLAMWAFERFGRARGWRVPHSENNVVCSEAVARILAPEFDLRDELHPGFDEVTPGSAYEVLKALLQLKRRIESQARRQS